MIKIEHLNKFYGKKQILKDVSFNIETNRKNTYGIVGPNGAGKTTIIKVMMGLLSFSSGKLYVDQNSDYEKWSKENMVLIPSGERGLRFKNTVYDNIMFFSAMKGIPDGVTKKLLKEYCDLLSFGEFLYRRIETLSMGQKKKAMILCGLCTNMRIIIMDEPSNGLDIDSQEEMKKIVSKMTEELDKTIIISSHDLDFLSEMTNHYFFLFDGAIRKEIKGKKDVLTIRQEYMLIKELIEKANEGNI